MAGNVLVTAAFLHEAGIDILREAGFETHYCLAYPTGEDVARRCAELQPVGIIVRQGEVTDAAMRAAPGLKVLSKHGVGYNNIDVAAATARGIAVVIGAGANDLSVAEHALAFSLMLLKDIAPLDRDMRAGNWRKTGHGSREIAGLSFGIVGFGRIGKQSARLARAVGFKVAAFDPYLRDDVFHAHEVRRTATLDELLAGSDLVSLHTPLTPETRGMIDAAAIARMRPGAYLVNTARGGVVDERALLDALERSHLAAAALDVFAAEPLPADDPLLLSGRLVITPHMAGVSDRSTVRMAEYAARNAVAVLQGGRLDPDSLINPEAMKSRTAALVE
jgi:D-3-phosphoglycerate dehydrogenase